MVPLQFKSSRRLWLLLFAVFLHVSVVGYFAYETFIAGRYVRAVIGFFVMPVFLTFAIRKPALFRHTLFISVLPVFFLN